MCHKTKKAEERVRVWNVPTRKGRDSLDALWEKKVSPRFKRLLPTHSGLQKQRTPERITQHRAWGQGAFVQPSALVWLFLTPRPAARQASLSPTISWSLPKFTSTVSVLPSNQLTLCRPPLLWRRERQTTPVYLP